MKTSNSKKGQMQTSELILVVIIVMLMLVIGLSIYGNFQAVKVKDTKSERESLGNIELAQKILSMQEIACSHKETSTCVDMLRLESLSGRIISASVNSEFYNYYRSFFGNSKIEIEQVYPVSQTWLIYDRASGTNENLLVFPIVIYEPLNKANNFGLLKITRYT